MWDRVRVMVFIATFNNISVISWKSVLLVDSTGRKSLTCRKSLTNFIIYNVVSSTIRMNGIRIHNASGDRH
jgi:hypothetical protein